MTDRTDWDKLALMCIRILWLFVLAVSVPLGAEVLPNRLGWVSPGSGAWENLQDLYLSQGLALPSSTGPFSREEIAFYLSKVDRTSLDPGQAELLKALEKELNPGADYFERGLFAADTSLDLEVELLAGGGNPVNRIWDRGWSRRPPMADWVNRFWLTGFAYAEFHMDARQDPIAVMDMRGPLVTNAVANIDQLDGFFPSKGYLSFGVPHLEVKWGRSEMEWGQGVTGNLLISNAAGVHDHLTLTTYWDWFKMQLLYMDMDSYTLSRNRTLLPGENYRSGFTDDDGNVFLPGLAETNAFGYLRVADVEKGDSAMDVSRRLVSHRFEFRFPGNITFHLTEAMLFTATTLELRHLMPMFIYHNWFQQWNANPNFTWEAEWTPLPGFGLYAVLLGDYVTTTFKDSWYQDPHPLAMGYQLGMKTSHSVGKGTLSTVVEGVYIDPYTYLDEAVDWITMRRILTNYQNFVSPDALSQQQVMIIDSPLGYHLGPDSAAGLLRVSYRVPGAWKATMDLEGQLKGQVTLRSLHPLLTNSPSLDPIDGTTGADLLPDQDASRHTLLEEGSMKALIFRLGGEVTPAFYLPALPEQFRISLGTVIKGVKNGMDPIRTQDPLKPLKGNDYVDLQFTLGLKWAW